MFDAMPASFCAVGLCSVFKRIQRHVDRFISDCVQKDLKAFLIIKRNRLVQIVLFPKRNAGSPADIRFEHRSSACIHGAIQNSFDRAELNERTAICFAKLFVSLQILRS